MSGSYIFYATFGSGQPGFPGYLEVEVTGEPDRIHAQGVAHQRVTKATENRWCRLYDSLEEMHPSDRVYRGKA